jgi:hypothetical protein
MLRQIESDVRKNEEWNASQRATATARQDKQRTRSDAERAAADSRRVFGRKAKPAEVAS